MVYELPKKYTGLVGKYYDYLKNNHYGAENGIKATDLADIMGIGVATQKYILKEINENPQYHKLVSTCGSIYMCRSEEEVDKTLNHTWNTAITLIKKARNMTNKASRNNQYQMQLGKYYKDIVTVFEDKNED